MNQRVLIIEDAEDIAKLVQLHLGDLGFEVDIAADGQAGLNQFQATEYDLVILDIMLPGMNGLDVCRALRAQPHYVAILMLTAKSTEMDRVLGLEMGADDYLSKPFSIPELLARVKALFRRVQALETQQEQTHSGGVVTVGQLTIDVDKREVCVAGATLELTAKEFALLLFFARHPGTVFTRAQLLEHVWNYHYSGYEHTVNSHINRLRAKLESDPAHPQYIHTVWGVGYKFNDRQDN